MESGDVREEPKGKVPSSAQRGEKKERLNTTGYPSGLVHPRDSTQGEMVKMEPQQWAEESWIPANTTGKDLWIPCNLERTPYSCSLHWTPVLFKLV